MRALHRKLVRELWHIRGQIFAIMMVIMGGVGVCVMSWSTYHSLQQARDLYYRDYHFADIFIALKRAPLASLQSIQADPRVLRAEARVVATANLHLENYADPIQGLITSLPDQTSTQVNALNRLYLLRGRLPDSRSDNEVVVSDGFANAHQLQPGALLQAVINGRLRDLRIVGTARSPEFIYQIAPGAVFPDYQHFAVMWMAYTPLAHAYDMESAFNNLIIQTRPEPTHTQTAATTTIQPYQQALIQTLDHYFTRYGGLGAYHRDEQISNRFLREEFNQLRVMAILFPTIFLSVAVFLLHVVVTRLINTQREIIAVLKAFGYSRHTIFIHYAQLIIIITALGILAGIAIGIWLGHGMVNIYAQYYSFPAITYHAPGLLFVTIAAITISAALTATARSVFSAASLPPAEAMRPAAPTVFHHLSIDDWRLIRHLSALNKMILRQLLRRPVKTLLAITGLALASAILMVGNFQPDAVSFMIHAQFQLSQKQDVEVTFNNPLAQHALSSLSGVPGVQYAEGLRSVPVQLHFRQRQYRTTILGVPDQRYLQAVLDTRLNDIELPEDGILLTQHLAKKLGIRVGDWVVVEILEGRREYRTLQVVQLSKQFLGTRVYTRQSVLNRIMHEGPVISAALLKIDDQYASRIYQRLRAMPQVASINLRQSVIDSLKDSLQRVLLLFTFINAVLGSVIALGVVYNTARIALAERGRELASLRVLGYTQAEVAYLLIAEMAVLTLLSLPIGFLFGRWLCSIMVISLETDLYRVPLVLSTYTHAFAAAVVLLSALISATLVAFRVRSMDLVEVLKTRE